MAGDAALESFLGRWLTARMRDPAVAKTVLVLHGSLSTLLQGDVPQGFRRGLADRISGLKALLERIDAEDVPPAAPDSIRGKWLRAARRLVDRWDDAEWVVPALELTGEKNPLLLSAVSQSLEEAVEQGRVSPQAVEPLRKLRARDDRDLGAVPLPPASQAPWCPSAYVFPTAGRALAAGAERCVIEAVRDATPDSPATGHAKALAELFRLIDGGWPVPRARLVGSLRELAALMPEGSNSRTVLQAALRLIEPAAVQPDPEPATAPAIPDATDPDAILRRARASVDELARQLLAEPAPEAQEFGRRLEGIGTLPDARTAYGLHQELVGCLSFLDESDGPGPANRWRRTALDRLARIAQPLGGGEVIEECHLLGQPLSRWTEFVTFVGYDDHAPQGEPGRITRVERNGYVLIFSDGTRKALVRPHVRLAL